MSFKQPKPLVVFETEVPKQKRGSTSQKQRGSLKKVCFRVWVAHGVAEHKAHSQSSRRAKLWAQSREQSILHVCCGSPDTAVCFDSSHLMLCNGPSESEKLVTGLARCKAVKSSTLCKRDKVKSRAKAKGDRDGAAASYLCPLPAEVHQHSRRLVDLTAIVHPAASQHNSHSLSHGHKKSRRIPQRAPNCCASLCTAWSLL